jgi:hypothetical protein
MLSCRLSLRTTRAESYDAILFYSKTDELIWNQLYEPLDQVYVESKYRFKAAFFHAGRTDASRRPQRPVTTTLPIGSRDALRSKSYKLENTLPSPCLVTQCRFSMAMEHLRSLSDPNVSNQFILLPEKLSEIPMVKNVYADLASSASSILTYWTEFSLKLL